jgi:Rhodopirellula transposase DDE domain
VISVDTKKKELVGAFKNGGRRWLPKGKADQGNLKGRGLLEHTPVVWGGEIGNTMG